MHARSALFDLYGAHLRTRGDRAPVAALVRLLPGASRFVDDCPADARDDREDLSRP